MNDLTVLEQQRQSILSTLGGMGPLSLHMGEKENIAVVHRSDTAIRYTLSGDMIPLFF